MVYFRPVTEFIWGEDIGKVEDEWIMREEEKRGKKSQRWKIEKMSGGLTNPERT